MQQQQQHSTRCKLSTHAHASGNPYAAAAAALHPGTHASGNPYAAAAALHPGSSYVHGTVRSNINISSCCLLL